MKDKIKLWWQGVYRQRWLLAVAALSVGALLIMHANQIGVLVLKLALVTLFAALGYYIDRAAFPYARPHELLDAGRTPSFDAAQIRRSLIIAASMLAGSLAL